MAKPLRALCFSLIAVYCLPGHAAVDTKPFSEFLLQTLPSSSRWYFRSGNKAQQATMQALLSQATPLPHFAPFRLIRLVHFNPATGYPGVVMEDTRIVYNPANNTFAVPSLAWISEFRHDHALSISGLSDQELMGYLLELISLFPRHDNHGLTIVSVGRLVDGDISFAYKKDRGVGPALAIRSETMRFGPEGAILAAPLFDRRQF